jgi:hypothetical protein
VSYKDSTRLELPYHRDRAEGGNFGEEFFLPLGLPEPVRLSLGRLAESLSVLGTLGSAKVKSASIATDPGLGMRIGLDALPAERVVEEGTGCKN